MRKTVLVTGGLGFIGSALIEHLIEVVQCRVVNVDAVTYAANVALNTEWQKYGDAYYFYPLDIHDGEALRQVLMRHRPVAVFHLAAETHVDRSIDHPALFLQSNTVGTATLIAAVSAYYQQQHPENFLYIQVSTDEVFGDSHKNMTVTDENSCYLPNSPYAASKAAADHWLRAYQVTYGLPAITTHAVNNFGPRQYPEKLIPLALSRLLAEQNMALYGDGSQQRTWLFVEDHVAGLIAAWQRGVAGAHYLFGGNRRLSNLALLQLLCARLDVLQPRQGAALYGDLITFTADRAGHDRAYVVNDEATRHALNWQPKLAFDVALDITIHAYLQSQ